VPIPRYWRVRQQLSPRSRARVRRVVDALGGWAIGSVAGGRQAGAAVALTFDDGPDVQVTERLLDVLADEHVHATFFVLLDAAEASPHLLRRALGEGHEVGLHGLDHRRLTTMGAGEVGEHIRAGRDRLAAVLGVTPRWFRPPFGAQDLRTFAAVRRAGMDVVVWSADGEDWVDQPAESIAARAVTGSEPGGIVLLHEISRPEPGREPEVASPPRSFDPVVVARLTIAGLRGRGLEPMSVGELVEAGGARRSVWFRP